jgi:hypothetical protein
MTDLERLFTLIVKNLAAGDHTRVYRPVALGDIRESIAPYRSNRRALQLESSEDYELVVMRLCAGEGGFARAEPEEARIRFAEEVQSPNPDLTLSQLHKDVLLTFDPRPLARALDPNPDRVFAPPHTAFNPTAAYQPPNSTPDRQPEDVITAPSNPPTPPSIVPRCPGCGGTLPRARVVSFCPHCGESQTRPGCPECQGTLEPGWRYCVECGLPVADA